MYKPKKTGVGASKNFGPIQKLQVPDFQHITNQYEQMQNEVLDQPPNKRKQVKNFSIRKLTQPSQVLSATQAASDALKEAKQQSLNQLIQQTVDPTQQMPLDSEGKGLTEEEQRALKPRDVKVDNPWIFKQTHEEYLKNIKGLPARHANVIQKHEQVHQNKTFIPIIEQQIDKDQATKDAIALLDKEYEIFNNVPGMQGVKVLTRYDTWDEDRTVEEWISYCNSKPDQAHALSPVYQGYEYCWKPVQVLSYEYKERKFKVKVMSTGQEKLVTRLSLLFFNEDPDKFKERVNQCKQRQEIVEAELRFTNLVDKVPTDQVSTLSKDHRFYFLAKSVRDSDKFDPTKIYDTFIKLLRVVEEEYIRQMKKCVVLKEMEDPANFEKYAMEKVPIRLEKKTSPYFGVVRCPKYSFSYHFEEIKNQHFSSDEALVSMTRIFIQKCIDFQQQRYLQTKMDVLKLPRELTPLKDMQKNHHKATQQNVLIQWREFLVGEIMERLREGHDFFLSEATVYEESGLKRIITRFEYILNTYLRQFVQTSVNDWVQFIRMFTNPNLANDELWKVNTVPCITINLHQKKKAKKGKDKKKTEKKGDGKEDEKAEDEVKEDDDDRNRVIFDPSIDACEDFIVSAMDMIVDSTNKIFSLEKDLMPFLDRSEKPNFFMTSDFPWIVEAKAQLSQMIQGNIAQPNELLARYQKYEYIINTEHRALVDKLFKGKEGGKESLDIIENHILAFEKAHYEIMTLSEDEVNFRVFQVKCKKLKNQLGDKANEIKRKILDATYEWCMSEVDRIDNTYTDMRAKVEHNPADEQELVDTQLAQERAPKQGEALVEELKEVDRHICMLDRFSYRLDDLQKWEADIEGFYLLKIWPQQMQASTTEGKQACDQKREDFNTNLDKEKEAFKQKLVEQRAEFNNIIKFKDVEKLHEYTLPAYNLKKEIEDGFEKATQFNNRENIFRIEPSLWPELDELSKDFAPFSDLISLADEVLRSLNDWEKEKLYGQSHEEIKSLVFEWQSKCKQLAKKLDEDYPDTADVAKEINRRIDEFSKNLPLIRCFLSEAVANEDWNDIVGVVESDGNHIPNFEKEEITVEEHIKKYDLYKYVAEIEDITMRAEKKFGLKQKLNLYKADMKGFELEQKAYKENTGTYLLKGYDDCMAKLDDIIVGTQTMLGSSYMKGVLKHETTAWERKLQDASELMEAMMKTQRDWMYLEPIFSSGDIGQTMPKEYKMFMEVDAHWRKTMATIHEEPGLMFLLQEQDGLKAQFDVQNSNLQKIQKALNDYLEQKRLVFARFFFLGSDELLQILANTKDPLLVQPYMNKCFEGIEAVQFDPKQCIYGMVSAEGETVEFNGKIDVNEGDRKGNVEKWMLDIEAQMRGTLKDISKKALTAYPTTVRTDWTKMWPGQIVLAISQIFWTNEVEKALEKGNLQDYVNVQDAQIEEIVQIVRTPLKSMERVTMKALVVIDVHAREVVEQMRKNGVESTAEFQWTSQLRYYWEDKDQLRVKMVTAIIPYAYEYLGNSPRLVITDLTDKCYRTLLGAKYLNYGGAPEGPAGTGKTESVKDLAKAIAVQCVVFNCSDGINYLFMSQFFKGLAQSGAWCCFDEFNRIDLEVLSVIAQQIQVIQQAIKNPKLREFEFMGTTLSLNRACAVNITMNPAGKGYGGRSVLPDNLKALFRPCAMMVPDYALIAQIELLSFGFSEASTLSVKVVASLRLSSEQLSSQDHYDFGMRAVKSILNACGNNRRTLSHWSESHICLKALQDVNLPKFTSNDIPLYKGITSDLFPNVEMEQQDYTVLIEQLKESCKRQNIQPKQIFIQKCIELYETLLVRHGLMVFGDSYSGKSKVIRTLQEAISSIKDDPNFVNVQTFYANPKSITQNQLYGVYDMDTQEWSDGVLAILIRNCAESTTPDRKWICFDGPVDPVWIESMNTVLDDNKKLCLNSGQIIKLKPTMTIMLQTDDLQHASPATISRCGMVLLESHQLGHNVFIKSYCDDLRTFMEEKTVDKFEKMFNYVADVCVEYIKMYCKPMSSSNGVFVVSQVIRYLETYIKPLRPKPTEDDDEEEEHEMPKDIDDKLSNALVFSTIWGIGGIIDESTRDKFNIFFSQVMAGDEVVTTNQLDLGNDEKDEPKMYEAMKVNNKVGECKTLFDMYFDMEDMRWIPWLQTREKYVINKEQTFLQLSIPTTDQIRTQHICKSLLTSGLHAMLIGPTGTGKSMSILQMLEASFSNDEYSNYQLTFSAQTTAAQTEMIIDGKMEKKKRGVYGPKMNRKGIIFVDDLNMPLKNKFGAQPPIELLRQYMDYGGWYDIGTPEREFRTLTNCNFCGAMGRNTISPRYIRHFNVIYCEPFAHDSLSQIFSTIMDWLFTKSNPPFPQPVQQMKEGIVNQTVMVYEKTAARFRPTPAKGHYSYNLRDIAKVFQGISKSSSKAIVKEDDMIRLWAHECSRVFQDRLISQEDRDDFQVIIGQVMKEKFKKDWHSVVKVEPLLFASYVPFVYPGGDTTKKPLQDVYCEWTDLDVAKKGTEDKLAEYNNDPQNASKQMDLVLFMAAIEHVVKIHRIITTEFGHALLIGVGGSGRKSMTALATFIAGFETFQIEITKNYNFDAWREDMRDKLYAEAGTREELTSVFLLNDTQIINESFLEDINNVLNNGEIPNLFATTEEINNVVETMLELFKSVPGYTKNSTDWVFNDFREKCKQSVHVVLTMSPIGEDFRRRLRMFPSLVNCCAIDYFLAWPQDALQSVASYFVKDIEDLPEMAGCVNICVDMQTRTTDLALKFKLLEKRYFYVTPTSYLVLLKNFKKLLGKKRGQIDSVIHKYDVGIKQLAEAKTKVAGLQEQLTILMPQLTEAKKENEIKKQKVQAKTVQVDAEKKIVEKEEAIAKDEKQKADAIQYDCEFELSNVMPIFQKAQRAVAQLSQKDVDVIKSLKAPSAGALIVTKSLCIIFGHTKPIKSGSGRDAVEDWFATGKKHVLNSQLLNACKGLDKDKLRDDLVEILKVIIKEDDYSDECLKRAGSAAFGLGSWVAAMVQYYDAMKIVKPKEAALAEAKAASEAAQAAWDAALAKLEKVQNELKALNDDLEAAIAKEKKLTDEFQLADKRCNRAKSLIEKLKDEEVAWKKALDKNREDKKNLVGDILLSAGVIAYLGVFTSDYRAEGVKSWQKLCKSFEIKCAEKFTLEGTLGIPTKIQQWVIEGLPNEAFAKENAIIMDNSSRWPLMIDPQMQGLIWIRGMESNLEIIKPTMEIKEITNKLKATIQYGKPCLLADSNETFDALIEPVLAKAITKRGNGYTIKIGDDDLEYDEGFKFYITTKLSKPHFAPEVCVLVNLLNMMVTGEGLFDQILSQIIKNEDFKLMEKFDVSIKTKAENDRKKSELEDKILNQIAHSEVDILDDDVLMEILDESKLLQKQIQAQNASDQTIRESVEKLKNAFEISATRVSRLFFVLLQIMNVNAMYQYSLSYFKGILDDTLEAGKHIPPAKKNDRKLFYRDTFCKFMYENICRSLFEVDKLLFSLLIYLQIQDEEPGRLNKEEVNFIMMGITKVADDVEVPNPTGDGGWLTEKSWAGFNQLNEQFEVFKGIDDNVIQNTEKWERIYNLQNPQDDQDYPEPFNKITLMQRAMLMRVLRPDKVIPIIQEMIIVDKEMGKGFITPPTFDMKKTFSDSKYYQPIIIVLSSGADPMGELEKLAAEESQRVQTVSLGQGQAQIAINKIKEAQEIGQWIVLQNCHLSPSFMPTLDGLIEKMIELEPTTKFRLWLTSMPSEKFPVTILQGGVKATIEPPKGFRNNLLRSYSQMEAHEFENVCEKPAAYKCLMWGLCFFNALILERRKFGPLGWNIPYEFSNSDLAISQAQLVMFLNHFEKIPWDALRYMVAEANYGGRVTDINDRNLIVTILEDFYNPSMLKPGHVMTQCPKYVVPPLGELDTYVTYIENELPINDLTEVFGLHDNAEITSMIGITQQMLEVALQIYAGSGGGGGASNEDAQMTKVADEILAKVPKPFDIEVAAKKHPINYFNSMNTVLQQELLRYNKLTDIVRSSLARGKQAIKGEVPLTPELEALLQSLLTNTLPPMWDKRSYPSLKPLGSYIADLVERLKFMQNWVDEGQPTNTWISGLFFTQSFMTGAKQNYARKYTFAIDTIDFTFGVINDEVETDLTKMPEDGVYIFGLYLEGCRWDEKSANLGESQPKVLFTKMKTIHILPKKKTEIDHGHSYMCPVYKTAERQGSLTTTGHNTNFVVYIYLPIAKKQQPRHWIKRGVAMLTALSD